MNVDKMAEKIIKQMQIEIAIENIIELADMYNARIVKNQSSLEDVEILEKWGYREITEEIQKLKKLRKGEDYEK